MRRALAALIVLLPASALAQQAPAPTDTPPAAAVPAGHGGSQPITRAQFVQHAAEVAGHRFDAMDTAHAGVLTRAQMKAWREEHHARAGKNGRNGSDGQDG